MTKHAAHETREFLDAILASEDPRMLADALLKPLHSYGFEHIAFRFLPHNPGTVPGRRSNVITHTLSETWIAHYFEQGYTSVDQNVPAAIAKPRTMWSDIRPTYNPINKKIFNERRAFGILDGASWSSRATDGSLLAANVVAERLDYAPEDLPKMDFAATVALSKLASLLPSTEAPPQEAQPKGRRKRVLSPREQETLAWAAEGLRTEEIAARMGISDNGVEANFRCIRRKLGTTTRTHSVAEALRQRLIV